MCVYDPARKNVKNEDVENGVVQAETVAPQEDRCPCKGLLEVKAESRRGRGIGRVPWEVNVGSPRERGICEDE